jgi:ADP-ribosylglycohydrolase
MIGAISGDVLGSIYEFDNNKSTDFVLFNKFCRYTDDTVLTIATADCLLNKGDFAQYYKKYFLDYPDKGYGGNFKKWGSSGSLQPYNSWGNGSAMRISPVGFAFNSLEFVLINAKKSAKVTHNHPEGVKGAQAVASAIFMAKSGSSKNEIKEFIESKFYYKLDKSLDEIRSFYSFDESCQGSVPQAITAFLESDGFEDSIRKAISIGGDSDTIASIAGGIAEAYYDGVPEDISNFVLSKLDKNFLNVINDFYKKFINN